MAELLKTGHGNGMVESGAVQDKREKEALRSKIEFIQSYGYEVRATGGGYLVTDLMDDTEGWRLEGGEGVLDETIEMIKGDEEWMANVNGKHSGKG